MIFTLSGLKTIVQFTITLVLILQHIPNIIFLSIFSEYKRNLIKAGKKVQYDLGEYPCHNFLGDSQYFTISELGELRNEYMCATASTDFGKVYFYSCN